MPDKNSRPSDVAKLPAVVRIVKALEEAAEALDGIEAKYGLNADQRMTLLSQLQKEMGRRIAAKKLETEPLPAQAPELWADREGRKENPVAFIRRVYGRWLKRGLKRGDLRSLDQPLYQALAVWMHRHPDDEFSELGIEASYAGEEQPAFEEKSWAEEMRKAGKRLAKQPHDK